MSLARAWAGVGGLVLLFAAVGFLAGCQPLEVGNPACLQGCSVSGVPL